MSERLEAAIAGVAAARAIEAQAAADFRSAQARQIDAREATGQAEAALMEVVDAMVRDASSNGEAAKKPRKR